MARLIWDKDGGKGPDARLQRFLCGDDIAHDRILIDYDIRASRAHVAGLERIGLLSPVEAAAITSALERLVDDLASARFTVDDRYEDCHSAIEDYLIDELGDVGKKVHLGRSRNDQVLAAMRLYLRDFLAALELSCSVIAREFLDRAAAEVDTPMPGYTHLQRAVPSTAGMWLAGFAEAFIDDAALARSTRGWIDSSPLGSAAGYGVNLPLDRAGIAAELGHNRVQINPLYTQGSRGKVELQVLMALSQALIDVRRFAWDVSLFATAEFAFVRLPEQMTTGSSIMPNKRNPDVVELLRTAPATAQGAMAEVAAVLSLPSGYHRDLQASKGPVMRAVAAGSQALAVAELVVGAVDFDRERMRAAISPDMFATDRAVELAGAGMPFRDAYRQVAAELDQLADLDADASVAARVSPGACANLMIDELRARLAALAG